MYLAFVCHFLPLYVIIKMVLALSIIKVFGCMPAICSNYYYNRNRRKKNSDLNYYYNCKSH